MSLDDTFNKARDEQVENLLDLTTLNREIRRIRNIKDDLQILYTCRDALETAAQCIDDLIDRVEK